MAVLRNATECTQLLASRPVLRLNEVVRGGFNWNTGLMLTVHAVFYSASLFRWLALG